MRKIRPLGAFAIILTFSGIVLAADYVRSGLLRHPGHELVRADAEGLVRLDVRDLDKLEVRFYRFLNAGNQEVKFLVGRDEHGVLQVAFNAGNSHYKVKRGFSYQDGWIIDNKCETTTRLSTINDGGSGCRPAPLAHRESGGELILREADVLEGWRYFR